MKASNTRTIISYLFWLLGGTSLFLLKSLLPNIFNNPILFSIGLVFILIFPGWLMGRLSNIKTNDFVSRVLICFVLGLGFYLVINLLAIFIGISLETLIKVIIGLIFLLFIGAFMSDYQKLEEKESIQLRFILEWDNVYYVIPVLIGGFILWLLYLQGPNLNGDPYLHLSIINKALMGNALDSRSLAFTEAQAINPAYVYPVWQIFLAFVAKIFSLSIFQVWSNIIYTLAIFSFFAWYLLAKVIFNSKVWTVFALSLMMIFTLYAGPGYLFSRLGVPDTLAQLVILPLSMVFFLKYVFEGNRQNAIMTAILSFVLLAIHGPHYFYLLITIFFFGMFYVIFYFKDKNYCETLLKILKIFFLVFSVLVFLAIAIEIKSKTVIATLADFYKSSGGVVFQTSFSKFGQVYKFGYFLLSISALFLIKSRRFLFVVVSMLLVPIIYWTPLKDIFNKILSGVFTDRLLANTSLYFFVFTIVFAGLIVLIGKIINKVSNKNLSNIILISIFIGLIVSEIISRRVSDFTYYIFYDKSTNIFVNNHAWWFFALGLLIALVVYFLLRLKKIPMTFDDKNPAIYFLITLMILFVLISPSIENSKNLKVIQTKKGEAYFLAGIQNDQSALNYIKTQISPKSVLLASGEASKGLSTLVDQYMAYNAGTSFEKKFKIVLTGSISDAEKLKIVTSPQWAIDYIYLAKPEEEGAHFRKYPEKYQLIYKGKSEIYLLKK